MSARPLQDYLSSCREMIAAEIRRVIPRDDRHTGGLYRLMLDYPLRPGKALRPALCLAVCRALGGAQSAVLPTAAVLELYHNAFLIHDDVEDASSKRRHELTLNALHGVPSAVNVGDGMLALAIGPLLDNMAVIGVGRALRILRLIARMACETAEGQMIELNWIKSGAVPRRLGEYSRLVHKKTAWYSFIAPMSAGAIIGGAQHETVARIARLAIPLGIAFQIQDDVLNLATCGDAYGKDSLADLWEGKRTLILIHAINAAPHEDRATALEILAKRQPRLGTELDTSARAHERSASDVEFLRRLVELHGSLDFARQRARRFARRFRAGLAHEADGWARSRHRDFLFELADYAIDRAT
ncbi:polyprenyl synthetase family protein [Piscinibacter koreensis]|uniref:Polyprenyl synthetase family protein n=1 Tax=Piscinibacter koreensis TaxID=2742824 RepID=A0A7Y6TWD5_9BURK|nr:polyprenyl synthetase family protein [Schlegelella koreensis]NUZ05912.1 polyprenyl synthetase family protein [Schlegelella koreensis]